MLSGKKCGDGRFGSRKFGDERSGCRGCFDLVEEFWKNINPKFKFPQNKKSGFGPDFNQFLG